MARWRLTPRLFGWYVQVLERGVQALLQSELHGLKRAAMKRAPRSQTAGSGAPALMLSMTLKIDRSFACPDSSWHGFSKFPKRDTDCHGVLQHCQELVVEDDSLVRGRSIT